MCSIFCWHIEHTVGPPSKVISIKVLRRWWVDWINHHNDKPCHKHNGHQRWTHQLSTPSLPAGSSTKLLHVPHVFSSSVTVQWAPNVTVTSQINDFLPIAMACSTSIKSVFSVRAWRHLVTWGPGQWPLISIRSEYPKIYNSSFNKWTPLTLLAVAVLGWGQGAQAPQILPRPPKFSG